MVTAANRERTIEVPWQVVPGLAAQSFWPLWISLAREGTNRAKFRSGHYVPQPSIELTDWLRTLELDQYAPQFFENHITGDLLPNLTADDLKDLGVNSVGHRR